MERNIYENPVRAAEEGNTHAAISVEAFQWRYRDKPVKVRILYRKGDYELRFAGSPSIRVPDMKAAWPVMSSMISRCRRWRAVNWL